MKHDQTLFGNQTRLMFYWVAETVSNLFDHGLNEKKCFPVFDQMFVDVPVISHTIKQGV